MWIHPDTGRFLRSAKQLIAAGRLDVVYRKKTLHALSSIGLTVEDAKDILLELTKENYVSGPSADHTQEGEVWVFKKDIEGTRFYIKLKIDTGAARPMLKCLAFHPDEY